MGSENSSDKLVDHSTKVPVIETTSGVRDLFRDRTRKLIEEKRIRDLENKGFNLAEAEDRSLPASRKGNFGRNNTQILIDSQNDEDEVDGEFIMAVRAELNKRDNNE